MSDRRRIYDATQLRGPRVNPPSGRDADRAMKLRRTFTQKSVGGCFRAANAWPAKLKYIGHCLAVSYSSDKWKKDGDFVDYKHIVEAPQEVYAFVCPATSHIHGEPADVGGKLPNVLAELAPLLFIDAQLVTRSGEYQSTPSILQPSAAILYGGYADDEPFLCVGSQENGMMFLITGEELDVEEDGITGLPPLSTTSSLPRRGSPSP